MTYAIRQHIFAICKLCTFMFTVSNLKASKRDEHVAHGIPYSLIDSESAGLKDTVMIDEVL
jgi:hypothetical protein